MEAEPKQQPQQETRRRFLIKSGKVAGLAVSLPIIMTLKADEARAMGSGVRRRRQANFRAQRRGAFRSARPSRRRGRRGFFHWLRR